MNDEEDYWLNLSRNRAAEDSPAQSPQLLDFIEFPDVEPLDAQFGQWPVKSVPGDLAMHLFDPAKNMFAIVDAGGLPGGFEDIATCGLPFLCLFRGKAADDLRDEAPYLVQITQDAPFTRRLFTDADDNFGLWARHAAMFLCTDAGLEEVCDHFRRFTRFQDAHGKWFHFRFWDGALFPDYWRHFATSYERVARFFCAADHQYYFTLFLHFEDRLTRIAPDPAQLGERHEMRKPFALNADDFAFFQGRVDQQLKDEVVEKLTLQLADAPADKRRNIVGAVDTSFAFIRSRAAGRPVHADACLRLSFLIIIWDDLADDIMRGPVLSEPLLPIDHRIKLAEITYFETINRLIAQEN